MATSPVHTHVKKMELLLECSICTETLTQPRTLSCFHSFCKHCLDKFVTTLRETAVKEGAKLPEIFECPICRTEFHVKEGESVQSMPLNHFINNMVELLTLQQRAESIKCQSCKAQEPAASRCVSCEKYLCQKCLTVHNNWSAFEDHVVLTVEELSKPENQSKARGKPRCEKHNKVLKFYCETCKVLVCRYCMDLNHQRPEHLWFPLADVIVQHKEALKKSAAIFEQQMKKANESNVKIECAMESLKINAEKAKHAIAHQKQEILNELTMQVEKEMAVLLGQVDARCNKMSQPLMKQQADMNAYIAKTKSSLEFAKNIISRGSNEEIVSIKHEVEEKADGLAKERPALMEPVHNGVIDYQPKTSGDILKNVELKAFGQIGM